MTEQTLHGKVALVTGAGSGLGEATAKAFGEASASVAVVDIAQSNAERVSRELSARDVASVALRCDVSDEASVAATVEQVVQRFARLDVVVNCAAIDHTLSVD